MVLYGLIGEYDDTPLKKPRKTKHLIVEGMQSFEDDRKPVAKPACALKPAKAGTSSVSYAALRMAYVAVAKLRGLSEKAAQADWLQSLERQKSIDEMSTSELIRRRMGPYRGCFRNLKESG